MDTVSGATFSSNGILKAVQKALEQASVNVTPAPEVTVSPTPVPTTAPAPVIPDTPKVLYNDGTYTGTGIGYGGNLIYRMLYTSLKEILGSKCIEKIY